MTIHDTAPDADRLRGRTVVLTAAFLACMFLTFALPIYSEGESVFSSSGGEVLPVLVLAGVVMGLALAGRKSPVLAGMAAGVVALIALVYGVTVIVVVLLTSWFGDFGISFGPGMAAIAATVVFGIVAIFSSKRGWRDGSPSTWTPVAVGGACAIAVMFVGLCIPPEGMTLAGWLGFDVNAVVGLMFLGFIGALALVGIAGFACGRWGVGLLGGFIGFILVAWLMAQSGDQSEALSLSGVDGSGEYHALTAIGFWASAGLFVVHAIQQLATPSDVAVPIPAPATPRRPVVGTARWAADPYRRGAMRYFDGTDWTTDVSNGDGTTFAAIARMASPADPRIDWHPDPFGRHAHRYFDGTAWTKHVSDDGVVSIDRPVAALPTDADDHTSQAPPAAVGTSQPTSPTASATFAPMPSANVEPAAAVSPVTSAVSAGVTASERLGIDRDLVDVQLRFSDGRLRPLDRPTIIGRDPATPADLVGSELLQVDDRTVSKTHAVIGVTDSRVWVRDLNSSNGIAIDNGSGERPVSTSAAVTVDHGDRVVLGDATSFVVEIRPIDGTIPRSSLPSRST